MPTIVISAVNIVEGGMLKVLQDCLHAVRASLPDWRVIALVNNEGVVNVEGVEAIPLPQAKGSWLRRVYTEYVTFHQISKDIYPDIWWSLHDMSPRVQAKSQFVYCHNCAPFTKFSIRELTIEPTLIMFSTIYSWFYRINIKSNRAVIVQQDWLRKKFEQRYGVNNVIVAHPIESQAGPELSVTGPILTFAYPSLPRVFKNFELICEAAKLLETRADWKGRILLTIGPDENRLTRNLFERYGKVRGIHFIGRQNRAAMNHLYGEMDCLLFPSRLETWGLPITEAKSLGKPMIVADLPYAHETAGTYSRVRFVDPSDPQALAVMMLEAHRNGWASSPVVADPIPAPFADSWPQLVQTVVALHEGRVRTSEPLRHTSYSGAGPASS